MSKNKLGILGLAAFTVLVVLLVACGIGNGNDFNSDCGGKGTYHIVVEKQADKEDEFKLYKEINANFNLVLSEADSLDKKSLENRTLFEDSIKANRDDPYGKSYQKYNYVVCEEVANDGVKTMTIWVARWQETVDFSGISANCSLLQNSRPQFPVDSRKGMMINSFPEEDATTSLSLTGQQSPCWLSNLTAGFNNDDREKIKKLDGLLDAISKHYLIAQQDKPIKDFNAEVWSKTRVRYAGEIIVDVKNCEYWLNNGSGTYLPNVGGDWEEIRKVAQLFSDKLGVGPTFVIDFPKFDRGVPANVDGPTKIHVPLDCGN